MNRQVYAFGPFVLDPSRRLLRRDGQAVSINAKALDLLVALVERRERVVSKDELLERLWPDVVVEEANLPVNVSALRKVLGETPAEHRYIATVSGKGYQFVAPVRQDTATDESPASPQGVMPANQPVTASRAWSRPWGLVVVAGAALVGVGVVMLRSPTIESIVVVPFVWLTPEGEDDYLAVGLADALMNRLAGTTSLVVRIGPPPHADAGAPSTPLREHRADAQLSGTLQREGGRLRATARLHRSSDAAVLWAESVDAPDDALFELQEDLADRVAEHFARTDGRPAQLRAARTVTNLDAHREYLKGRVAWNRRTPDGYRTAIEHFHRAIALDGQSALAFAGLADCYVFGGGLAIPPADALTLAETAARQALALDASLAAAHASLAFVLERLHWNRADARASYERALALDPEYATAHDWYGLFLAAEGSFAQAIAELRRAQELEPLSAVLQMDLAWVYLVSREYDVAAEEAGRALDTDPSFTLAQVVRAGALVLAGRIDEATALLVPLEHHPFGVLAEGILAYAAAHSADLADARARVARITETPRLAERLSYDVAATYAALGDRDLAFEWMDRAIASRHGFVPWAQVDPRLDPLRGDERFASVLARVGLGSPTPSR